MINLLYKISIFLLAFFLILLIVLISIVGTGELTLKTIGWITVFFMFSSITLFIIKRKNS